jgi:hypothetical protein
LQADLPVKDTQDAPFPDTGIDAVGRVAGVLSGRLSIDFAPVDLVAMVELEDGTSARDGDAEIRWGAASVPKVNREFILFIILSF